MTSEEYSRNLSEKFEFYLLALVFTTLALAVQTARAGVNDLADILELTGWLLLLVSGIAGLSRLEWLPVAHSNDSEIKNWKRQRQELQQLAAAGVHVHAVEDEDEPVPVQQIIQSRDALIEKGERNLKRIERSTLRKYAVHKWCFVAALILISGARGYPIAESVAKRQLAPIQPPGVLGPGMQK